MLYTSMSAHTAPTNFSFHKNGTENYSNKEIKRIIVSILAFIKYAPKSIMNM